MHQCAGKFVEGHLAVCPVKDVVSTICNFEGHITKNCKSRRENVSIVSNHEIVDAEFVHLSDQPAVK